LKLSILIAILGLASCGALIAAIGGEEDPAAVPPPTSTVATTAPPADETTEPEREPEASQPETYEIGEKARDGGYQFTVTKVTCGVKRVGDQYLGEKAQGQFCMVKLRIKERQQETHPLLQRKSGAGGHQGQNLFA
jgi:hypothetical protein